MEEKKSNKKIIIVLIGIIGVCLIALGITYAYWILTREQTGENVVNTACLNITFTGKNDITLDKAYPLQPAELEKFLSTATPYHFTIHNECSDLASATINLESLTVSGKALEDDYIDLILYEDDYNINLNTYKKLTGNTPNDENKVITDVKHSYNLYNFTLKANEERDFNLLLYMDPETPMEEANMNASWKGKITLSANYKEDSRILRRPTSTNSMWEYKDKLTKIVIENKKSLKTAEDGGQVYGPFDESADGYGGVQSYVVCDENDVNCIGYLQSNGKISANSDSSNLFANFTKVTAIDGLENLDTSQVTDMSSMFSNMPNLENLNLETFDTSNVVTMYYMFYNLKNIDTLDLSNFKTNNVTNMSNMFYYSKINNIIFPPDYASNVTNCQYMFSGINSDTLDLKNVTLNKCSNLASLLSSSNIKNLILDNWKLNPEFFTNDVIKNVETLSLKNVDTTSFTNMSRLFNSVKLTELDLSDFDTENVTDMSNMFSWNNNLTNIIFPQNFGSSAITMFEMFYYSSAIKTLDLTNFNTQNVTNMYHMFNDMAEITTIDLSSFDTNSVTNYFGMFADTPNLQHITFGNKFVYNDGSSISEMFKNCPSQDRPTDDSWQGVSF